MDVEENDAYLGAAIFETLTSASVSLRIQSKNDGPCHYLPQRRKAVSNRYFQAFVKRFLHILEPLAESPIDDHNEWLKDPARIKKAKEAASDSLAIRVESQKCDQIASQHGGLGRHTAVQDGTERLRDNDRCKWEPWHYSVVENPQTRRHRYQVSRTSVCLMLHGMDRRFIYL